MSTPSTNHVISDTVIADAIRRLRAWPLHRARPRELFDEAWKLRHNITFADALYVAIAVQLDAPVLTGDLNLANAPNLPVPVLHIST
jgi:predicted nucleic acid-binding protein